MNGEILLTNLLNYEIESNFKRVYNSNILLTDSRVHHESVSRVGGLLQERELSHLKTRLKRIPTVLCIPIYTALDLDCGKKRHM